MISISEQTKTHGFPMAWKLSGTLNNFIVLSMHIPY